jgi:hypothetical protein
MHNIIIVYWIIEILQYEREEAICRKQLRSCKTLDSLLFKVNFYSFGDQLAISPYEQN